MTNECINTPLKFHAFWLSIGWGLVLLVVYLSLTPDPVSIPVEHGNKIGHLVAYTVLMLWFAQLYSGPKRRLGLAVAFAALGIGLEFMQLFADHRTYEVADMMVNSVGVAIGWLISPPRALNFLISLEAII